MAQIAHADDGNVELTLEKHEIELLSGLLDEMRTFLNADLPREDAVTSRLFPDAYENRDDAHAYRELVEDALRAEKVRALEEIDRLLKNAPGGKVVLSPELTESFLTVANDVRLAIGTRLEVTEETMAQEPNIGSPDAPAYAVLHWLGYLQEMIVDGLRP